jgi:hypothetical protein
MTGTDATNARKEPAMKLPKPPRTLLAALLLVPLAALGPGPAPATAAATGSADVEVFATGLV